MDTLILAAAVIFAGVALWSQIDERRTRRRNPALSGNEAIAAAMVKAARDKLLDQAA